VVVRALAVRAAPRLASGGGAAPARRPGRPPRHPAEV